MLHLPLPLGGSEAITQPTPKLVVSPLRTMQRREHFANHFPICGYVVIASYARHCAPQQKAGEKCRNRSFASLLRPDSMSAHIPLATGKASCRAVAM